MPEVRVIDRDGRSHAVLAETDVPLMFSLRDAGLPVEGTCGGTAGCGTCHVFVDPDWVGRFSPPEDGEAEMLSALEHVDPDRSRLSCQMTITDEHAGLSVTLAPEEFV